jgi:RNA recognition motif-containing protein
MTIHFLTRENAIRARNVLDRYTYKGNTIRVEWWRSVEEVVPRSSPQTPEQLALSSLPSSPAQSYANSIGPPVELSQIDDQNQGYYTQRRPRPATTSAYFRFESKSVGL